LPEEGYKSVSLPEHLEEMVRDFIENHRELGYRSVAEFVSEAIRLRLEDLKESEP